MTEDHRAPFLAHAAYDPLQLVLSLVARFAPAANAGARRDRSFSRARNHRDGFAFIDSFGAPGVTARLWLHHTQIPGEAIMPPLVGGRWVITQVESRENDIEQLRVFACESGGVFFDGNHLYEPCCVPKLPGLDDHKVALMMRIGIEHATAIDAMLSHPDIKVTLPSTAIKYPPAGDDYFKAVQSAQQCF